MAKPLTNDERTRIVDAIQAGGKRNEIARDFSRSPGTISNIAAAAGLSFDRSATKTACEAKVADAAARRAELQRLLVEDAHRLRQQLWEPCVERKPMVVSDGVQLGSHVEIVDVRLDRPPFADQQRIMTSVGIATDKVLAIDRHDNRNDEGLAAVDQWLRSIMGET